MRPPRVRFTVFRLLLVVAVCAIVTYVVAEGPKDRAREHYKRCLVIADNHARLGDEYLRNARGNAGMLRIAVWHDYMRRVFEDAATRPGARLPVSQPFPPKGWRAPDEEPRAVGG
jgi:hypothetical protein